MGSPGWAPLHPLQHPAGEGHWERLKHSQGAHLCFPQEDVMLQGVSPKAEQSHAPHTQHEHHQLRTKLDFRAVLQNVGKSPAP